MKKKSKLRWYISVVMTVLFCISLIQIPINYANAAETDTQKIKIRFFKSDGDYTNWDIWTWLDKQEGKAVQFDYKDEKGVYAVIDVPKTGELGYIIRKNDWSQKATTDMKYDLAKGEKEIIINYGEPEKPSSIDEVELYKDFDKITIRIHYNREDNDYDEWNLWNWIPDVNSGEDNLIPEFTESDDFGKIAIIEQSNIKSTSKKLAFIVRTDSWIKDGNDRFFDLAYLNSAGCADAYIKQGDNNVYYTIPTLSEAPEDNITSSRVPVLVGSIQKPISGEEWNPASTETVFKELGDGFYTLKAKIPAGDYQYKVAFGSWDESYGENGQNIKISLKEDNEVTFYYSDKTHLIKDSTNYSPNFNENQIPRLAGTIQSAIGEDTDWSPATSTLKLYDHNFNGIYSLDLKTIPKGSYEFKVTIGDNWDISYGDNGDNYKLNIKEASDVTIKFDSNTNVITANIINNTSDEFDGQVNGSKIYHNTWDSLYRYPFGAVSEGTDVTLRMKAQKGDLQYARILVRNTATNKSDLYNMEKVSSINDGNDEVDIWEATFTPEEAGVYGYKFIVGDGDTIKYYGEDGTEGKTGAIGDKNSLFFQMTVYDKDYKTPDWMKEAVVYQILTDRFNNGDKSNDTAKENARGNEPIEYHDSWSSLPDNPRLGETGADDIDGAYLGDSIWSNDFFGGDIKGIQEKLDYLQGLGVNTIYLNPISMAGSNHKYDATDYKALDSMFGSEKDFKDFTKELENRGMKLIVDGVFNHVGDDSIYFDRYGKYNTVGAYEYWAYVYDCINKDNISQEDAMNKANDYFVKSGQTFSKEKWHLWFNIKNQKVDIGTTNERYDYQCWWGYDSLPEFKSLTRDEAISLGLASESDEFVNKSSEWNNKSLVNYIYKDEQSVAKQWINWGADGWRLDVANEVDTVFWNDFREEMKAHNSETLILGEIWDDASKYFIGDQYDSVMNYRIRAALIDYLKNNNAEKLNDTLMAVYEDYPKEAFYALMNLMGSHDVARAIYILGGGSDTYNRAEFDDADLDLGKQRLKLAALFEFGYPGAPTIYYGDEAGVNGSKDPDNRRTYPWGSEDESLVSFYEAIGKVRENNKDLLSHGDLTTLYSKDSVYVYGRSYNDEHAIVAINPTNKDITVDINLKDFTGNGTEFIDQLDSSYKITVKDNKVTMKVPAMTGRMMASNNVVSLPSSVKSISGIEGVGQVELSWDVVENAKEYKIYSSNFKGSLEKEVKTVTNTKAIIDNLVNGNKMYFAVTAVDEYGNESQLSWGDALTPHFNIDWLGSLSDVNSSKVDISTPIEVSSEVYIEGVSNLDEVSSGLNGRLLVKYPGENNFTIIKGNYNGEIGNNDKFIASFIANRAGKYEYKFEFTTKGIYGFNDENSIKSTESKTFELSLGDSDIPTDLINLETPEQQSGEVNLRWTVSENNKVALYEIIRDGVIIDRVKANSTSYKDTDVRNKTGYIYKIIAYTKGGNSIESDTVKVTPDLVMVEVTFKLKAPSYTPLDAKVTMPGAMNGWDVGSWEMSRNGAVTSDWTYTISVLEGETIEYKYVKGESWDQEALMKYSNPKAANQSKYGCTTGEGGNEKIIVVNQGDGKMLVENEVVRWKDMPVVILDPSAGSITKNETIIVKGNSMIDPNLTINGEAVTVDKEGNFAHEVKLTIGENTIKVHIEPTEENKVNTEIFNNNEEAIGFATKDLELKITRLDNNQGNENNPGDSEDGNNPGNGENPDDSENENDNSGNDNDSGDKDDPKDENQEEDKNEIPNFIENLIITDIISKGEGNGSKESPLKLEVKDVTLDSFESFLTNLKKLNPIIVDKYEDSDFTVYKIKIKDTSILAKAMRLFKTSTIEEGYILLRVSNKLTDFKIIVAKIDSAIDFETSNDEEDQNGTGGIENPGTGENKPGDSGNENNPGNVENPDDSENQDNNSGNDNNQGNSEIDEDKSENDSNSGNLETDNNKPNDNKDEKEIINGDASINENEESKPNNSIPNTGSEVYIYNLIFSLVLISIGTMMVIRKNKKLKL